MRGIAKLRSDDKTGGNADIAAAEEWFKSSRFNISLEESSEPHVMED